MGEGIRELSPEGLALVATPCPFVTLTLEKLSYIGGCRMSGSAIPRFYLRTTWRLCLFSLSCAIVRCEEVWEYAETGQHSCEYKSLFVITSAGTTPHHGFCPPNRRQERGSVERGAATVCRPNELPHNTCCGSRPPSPPTRQVPRCACRDHPGTWRTAVLTCEYNRSL